MKKSLFFLISMFLFALPGFATAPVCSFSDVVSGPASGGEGGNGIYLSIFGKNFGAIRGASTVTVNGKAVAQFLVWGHNNDVTGNLDQIGVQVANGTAGTGNIVVTTPGGSCSNLPFTVRPGKIWYIGPGIDTDNPGKSCAAIESGTAGNGAGGNGTFANPWTLTNVPNIDTYSESQGAYSWSTQRTPETYYNCMAAGDTLVFLNGVSFTHGDGTGMHAALQLGSGRGSVAGFQTFMARPGASVQLGSQGGTAFGIRDYTDTYVVISGLGLTGSGMDGEGIEFATANAPNTRFVENKVTCPDCLGSAAAVSGGWELDQPTGLKILGNAVSNVACADAGGVSNKQYHSMYFFGNSMEVGWNKISNGCAYNGIQINYFTDESLGFGDLSIHDNDISGANGAGINLASVDPTQGPINIFNNVIHHVGLSAASDASSFHTCIAFPGEAPSAGVGTANVYNNTMYDCSSYLNKVADGNSCAVYLESETGQTGLTVSLVNNVMAQPAYTNTAKVNVYLCGGAVGTMLGGKNNLWFSDSAPGGLGLAKTVGSINNPLFVSTVASTLNLNLSGNSPAIGTGSALLASAQDFNGVNRSNPPSVGAFEAGNAEAGNQITVTAAPNPVTMDQPVTLTAKVAKTGTSAPSGSINFLNGGVSLGQAALNAESSATLVLPGLAAGSYSVVASYSGDSNDPAGQSGPDALQVLSTTTTGLAAAPSPVTSGQALTLTATVQGSAATAPGGTVNFLNGAAVLGTGTLNSSGVAALSIATLPVGTASLTAKYAGNGSFLASTSAAVSVTVAASKAVATTTTLAASPNPVTSGQTLALTATVQAIGATKPAGTVNFMNGSTVLGTGTLNSSGVAALSIATLPVGTASLTAKYAGNGSFLASTSAAVSVTVAASKAVATTTTLAASSKAATAGQAVTLTATIQAVGAAKATGAVNFMNGNTLLGTANLNAAAVATLSIPSLPVGTDCLTAQYAGNANFLASKSNAASVAVTSQATTTSLVASPATVAAGKTLTLTATVKWNGAIVPTGRVGFLNGAKLLGTGTLNSSGVATVSIANLAVGSYSIKPLYTGDVNFLTSTSPAVSVKVTAASAAASTTAILAASSNAVTTGQAVSLTTTVQANGATKAAGAVNFMNGNTLLGTANLNAAAVATLSIPSLPVGTNSLIAQYAGNANFLASKSNAATVVVTPQATTASLAASANPVTVGKTLTLTATVKWNGATVPTGNVGFLSGTTLLGKGTLNSSGVATLSIANLAAGSYSIKAMYTGDANYLTSTSPAISVTVKAVVAQAPKPTATTLTASSNTVTAGQTLAFTATVKSTGATLPNGGVVFMSGSTQLGTGALNSSGVAKLSIASLAAGKYSVTAHYNGNASFLASTSSVVSVTVNAK